jgi:hypothetical protein
MAALERANSVRLARAELKRAVARGDLDPADVVRDCPWQAESMTILELLTSQRRWGRTRARKFLVPLALNENKQLGTLSSRQRDLLAQSLAEKASLAEPSPSTQAESHQVGQELWDELVALSNRSNELTRELSRLAQRRDELIQSLSDLGAPRRAVAEAASLTVGRVQQIIDGSSKR